MYSQMTFSVMQRTQRLIITQLMKNTLKAMATKWQYCEQFWEPFLGCKRIFFRKWFWRRQTRLDYIMIIGSNGVKVWRFNQSVVELWWYFFPHRLKIDCDLGNIFSLLFVHQYRLILFWISGFQLNWRVIQFYWRLRIKLSNNGEWMKIQ